MPERNRTRLSMPETKSLWKFTTPERRSREPRRSSFNSRLGVNGPVADALPPSEKEPQKSKQDLEDISTKFAVLSTNSSLESLSKTSFNGRLSKVRSAADQKTENGDTITINERDNTECVIAKESPVEETHPHESLDEILSNYIKEELAPDRNFPSEPQDISKTADEPIVNLRSLAPISETMSKRDHLGNQRNGNVSTNGDPGKFSTSDESVITEEPALSVVKSNFATKASQPKEADEKYAFRRSDTYKPKRSQSPQCSTAKISRLDFPTSFGSGSKRRSYYDSVVFEEVEKYFNKRFYLSTKKNDWKLPEPSKLFSAEPWVVKELIECKVKLNAVKEKLDDLPLQEWHAHTKRRNKAGRIVWKLRKTINPEFPTQAWCKLYENVCSFELVPEKAKQEKRLNSVHLCEAPGAFITSLNYYIKTNCDEDFEWNWLGTTLNPHYEGNPLSLMINEDRFILHTMDQWTFGEDQTGNLMYPPNVANLMDRAEKLGQVLLVTADGSFDCQDNPGEQENYVAWLHYCEALSAMIVLAEGGNFLIKIFTMFEHMSICLLYLLSSVFEEVIVNKPATSKEGNSETYVVCKNYVGKGMIGPWISILIKNYGPNRSRKALFPKESIPQEFLDAVIECAETFREYQTDVIEANLQSFRAPSDSESSRNEQIRKAVTDEFFHRYRLKELPERFDIVGRHLINEMETYNMDPRLEVGTFSDKMKRTAVPDRQKILDLKKDLERLDRQVLEKWPADKDIWWYKFDSEPGHNLSNDMQIATGKPVKRINSSKFCLGCLLDIRNKVREIILESNMCKLLSVNSVTDQLVSVPYATSVLDFKNTLWTSSDAGLNAEEEHKAFKKIIEEFDKLSRDDNLVIYGYPLLTQFNVGLVYLLAHSFERVALTRPKGQNFAVIFEKHDVSNKKFKVKQKLDKISEMIQVNSPCGGTVLAMLPIQKLCTGDFYKYVTMANNICVKEQVQELIGNYLKATESKEERDKRRWTSA